MSKRIIPIIAVLCFGLLGFVGTAFAADAIAPDNQSNILDFARPAFDALMAGHYLAGAALALVFALTAFKRYAPGKMREFALSDAGGGLLALGISFFGAVATATLAGEGPFGGFTIAVAITSGKIAFLAAGGYVLVKKILVMPLLASAWYANKAPMWFKSVMGVVLWAFMSSSISEQAIEAGNEAVKDNPGPGADGIVGPPEQF